MSDPTPAELERARKWLAEDDVADAFAEYAELGRPRFEEMLASEFAAVREEATRAEQARLEVEGLASGRPCPHCDAGLYRMAHTSNCPDREGA